jgi:uncharacterized protein with FMN-binding domain
MKRAPIVIGSTAAGMTLLLTFHTQHSHLAISSGAGRTGTAKSSSGAKSTTPTTSPSPSQSTTAPTTAAPGASQPRTATGTDVQYRYGDIQVQVTTTGSKIDNVSIAQEGATDARSYQINSQAVPILESQTMSAQSTQIDGVSGATYTSQAYLQSLQSALDQLGVA